MAARSDPPISGRFRKGKSGNPKGRPKKRTPEATSAFDILISKSLVVVQNGVRREVTVDEALQQQLYRDAVKGNKLAQRQVMKMIDKREKARAKERKIEPSITSKIEPVDPDNADQALQILGIATPDLSRDRQPDGREHLLLEPWAVQAALKRRRGSSRLTQTNIREIGRCTRDSAMLVWPRGVDE